MIPEMNSVDLELFLLATNAHFTPVLPSKPHTITLTRLLTLASPNPLSRLPGLALSRIKVKPLLECFPYLYLIGPPLNNLPLTSDVSAWIYKMLLRDPFDPVTEVWEAGNSPMIFLLKAFSPKLKRINFYDGKFHILGHVGSQTFLGKEVTVLSIHMPANNKVRAQGEGTTKHTSLYLFVKLSIHDPSRDRWPYDEPSAAFGNLEKHKNNKKQDFQGNQFY